MSPGGKAPVFSRVGVPGPSSNNPLGSDTVEVAEALRPEVPGLHVGSCPRGGRHESTVGREPRAALFHILRRTDHSRHENNFISLLNTEVTPQHMELFQLPIVASLFPDSLIEGSVRAVGLLEVEGLEEGGVGAGVFVGVQLHVKVVGGFATADED